MELFLTLQILLLISKQLTAKHLTEMYKLPYTSGICFYDGFVKNTRSMDPVDGGGPWDRGSLCFVLSRISAHLYYTKIWKV